MFGMKGPSVCLHSGCLASELLLYKGSHLPAGRGGCWWPVGAPPQPFQVAWKPPSAIATRTEGNSFIFGVATGAVALSLRLQFTSG